MRTFETVFTSAEAPNGTCPHEWRALEDGLAIRCRLCKTEQRVLRDGLARWVMYQVDRVERRN